MKNYDAVKKLLGEETLAELDAMSPDSLNKRIVQAEQAMKQAKDELEANSEYQRAKTDLGILSQAKKEVNKRQKAIIQYCLEVIASKGLDDATG